MQSEKDGVEIDQGIFLAQVLAHARTRHASLPRHAAAEAGIVRALRANSSSDGALDFGPRARRAARQGRGRHRAATRASSTPRTTTRSTTPKPRPISPSSIRERDLRAARRRRSSIRNMPAAGFFDAGINLTHLYHGKIPYLWYIRRDMGVVNKMLRGLAMGADAARTRFTAALARSPGSRGVDAFAIGGGCQYPAGDGLRGGGERRLHDAAGAQGRHHPGRRQSAHAALRRRPHRAAGDLDGPAARLRHAGRPHDLRRDRAARRDRRGDRARGRRLHRLGRGQRRRQPARLPRRRGAARHCSAATWRSIAASRPIAISARR